MRILFICKKNENYDHYSHSKKHSGLFNSTRFIAEGLNEYGVSAKVVEVTDNNDIDREVSEFRPDRVVIEALWVIPEKFAVLKRLHPRVYWFVHLHSNIPFLASEGIALSWLPEYVKQGVGILTNCKEAYDALLVIVPEGDVTYVPNVYLGKFHPPHSRKKEHIDIGCFGAIRPLKNQLIQAVAAIEFARARGQRLSSLVREGSD